MPGTFSVGPPVPLSYPELASLTSNQQHVCCMDAASLSGWPQVILAIAVGVVVGTIVTLVMRLLYRPSAPRPGWTQICPSFGNWAGVFAFSTFTGFLAYVAPIAGSARADADTQRIFALLILVALLACTVKYIAKLRAIVKVDAHWRSDSVDYVGPGGACITKPLANVVAMQKLMGGDTVIQFSDGDYLRVDTNAKNLVPLCDHIMGAPPAPADEAPTATA